MIAGGVALTQPNDKVIGDVAYPKKLSDYGFFDKNMKPSSQLIAYDLNSPLFSDYAEKYRYIYIPNGMKAVANGNGLIQFPIGSAIIKSFGFKGQGLIETRVLLRRESGWFALPYVWNEEQDDAILKLAGKRLMVDFVDPSGKEQKIDYAVPNKNQCKECHGVNDEVMPIGPKIRNLNGFSIRRLINTDKLTLNNIFDQPSDNSLENKARVYLDINCGHCHNPSGSASNSGLFLNFEENDPVKYGVKKRPVAAGRGSGGLEFSIAPGKPDKSIIIYRMKSNEAGVAMPQIGRAIHHSEGVALIGDWIAAMDEN